MAPQHDLLAGLRWIDRPARESEITKAQSILQLQLPSEYLSVMREHDGGEGWVEDGEYLKLWPVSELITNNQALESHLLVPTTVLIGTNGGGELFGFQPLAGTYWSYPAVGLGSDSGKQLGSSWADFLRSLSSMA